MQGTIVGVLRGGPSREHDVSLRTGHAIVANLPPDRFTIRDIYIDRVGVWHHRGLPVSPADALRSVDVVVNGLHGEYGEDGEVQKVLDRHGVRYTGSDPLSSFTSIHKVFAKERAKEHGVLTPKYRYIEADEDIAEAAKEIVRNFVPPVVVKPVRWGSSIGVSLETGFAPLKDALTKLREEGADGILVEERIRGNEVTVGVVEGLRGEALYALPVTEVTPPEGIFSYDAKYGGKARITFPAQLPKGVSEELVRQSRLMHEALGLRHYSRSDFIISPRGIYYLETNSLPALGTGTLFTDAAAAVGVSQEELLTHLVEQALG